MRAVLLAAVLLAAVPAQADAAVVIPADPAEYAGRAAIGLATANGTRTPVALVGARGLLTSDSTRIDGLVTVGDVASRTATGRSRRRTRPRRCAPSTQRIERNDRWHLPLTIGLAVLLIGLALVRPQFALRALLVVLAANLWLSPVLALAAGVAVLVLPLGLACAAILTAYLVAMGLDAETVALSPFGPSQSGRYYGINNLLETMLLAPAIVGAALLGRAGIGVAALAFVTIGGNRFGADGGGMVVLAAAYIVLVLRLQGNRVTWRLAAAAAAGAVALALLVLGDRRGHRRLEPCHRRRRRRPGCPDRRHRRPDRALRAQLGEPRRCGGRARLARDPRRRWRYAPAASRSSTRSSPAWRSRSSSTTRRRTCSGSAPRSRSHLPATRRGASR